jgi:mannitol-specific phosphotransferase system IIBC component
MDPQPATRPSELTSREYAGVWWAFYWRATLIGALAGFAGGAIVGAILTVLDLKSLVPFVSSIVGLAANAVVTFFVLRLTLKKKYRGFEITVSRPSDVFD